MKIQSSSDKGLIFQLLAFFVVSFLFGMLTQSVFSEENIIYIDSNQLTGNAVTSDNMDQSTDSIEEIPSQNDDIREKPSPKDWIKESNISVYKDRVIIEIDNPEWARFTDTNSMDPVFDAESNAIEIVPEKPEDIQVGDIVSFNYDGSSIIHRVVAIGTDDKGWFMITKGDNNKKVDPIKTRFADVNRVVVAIIY